MEEVDARERLEDSWEVLSGAESDEERDVAHDAETIVSTSSARSLPRVVLPTRLAQDEGEHLLTNWLPAAGRAAINAMYASEDARRAAVLLLRPLFTYDQRRIAVPLTMEDESSRKLQHLLGLKLRGKERVLQQVCATWTSALHRCETRCRAAIEEHGRTLDELAQRVRTLRPSQALYRGRALDAPTRAHVLSVIEQERDCAIERMEHELEQRLALVRAQCISSIEPVTTTNEYDGAIAMMEQSTPADAVLALHTMYQTNLFNSNLQTVGMLRSECDRTWKRGLLDGVGEVVTRRAEGGGHRGEPRTRA